MVDPLMRERSQVPAPGHYTNMAEKLNGTSVSTVFGRDTRADKNEKKNARLPGPADLNMREDWTVRRRFKHTNGGSF